MFRTFSRIYENEFDVPLYFESDGQRRVLRPPANESDFCTGVNGGNGCCTTCALRVFPPPETLMPWTWSTPCRAGQQVTMVPVTVSGKAVAWLVSGHYSIGEASAGTRSLSAEVLRRITSDKQRGEVLNRAFSEIKIIPQARHDLMVRFLETCCALIGAELNHFLTGDNKKIQGLDAPNTEDPASLAAVADDEFALRFRLDTARRNFLRTAGRKTDIARVAKEAGWTDEEDFQREFRECFGESPSKHWKRVSGLWRTFSEILASSERQLVEAQPVSESNFPDFQTAPLQPKGREIHDASRISRHA